MNCIFVQISTSLINAKLPDDIAAKYYRTFWQNKQSDGFYRPEHFWELPTWIAELSYTLPDSWDRELYIVTDVESAIMKLSDDSIDYIFFSCMDSNREIIDKIINNVPLMTKIMVGGYCKPRGNDAEGKYNVYHWFDSIYEFCCVMGIDYKYGTDYSLFENYRTIPRLELSTGCKHHCKFCTIGNEIIAKSLLDIHNQLLSFACLDYRLIYINDKTFGQAWNYQALSWINRYFKRENPDFEGFIIQTTCNQICKPGFIDFLKSANVRYVELGVESFNDEILQAMNKPQNEKLIHKALHLLHESGIRVIGNIIIGLPGETVETYRHTIRRLKYHRLYSLNITNLVLYGDTKLSNEIESDGMNDGNELTRHKSYHTESDRKAIDWFYDRIFRLGLEIIGE